MTGGGNLYIRDMENDKDMEDDTDMDNYPNMESGQDT